MSGGWSERLTAEQRQERPHPTCLHSTSLNHRKKKTSFVRRSSNRKSVYRVSCVKPLYDPILYTLNGVTHILSNSVWVRPVHCDAQTAVAMVILWWSLLMATTIGNDERRWFCFHIEWVRDGSIPTVYSMTEGALATNPSTSKLPLLRCSLEKKQMIRNERGTTNHIEWRKALRRSSWRPHLLHDVCGHCIDNSRSTTLTEKLIIKSIRYWGLIIC